MGWDLGKEDGVMERSKERGKLRTMDEMLVKSDLEERVNLAQNNSPDLEKKRPILRHGAQPSQRSWQMNVFR